MHQYGIGTLDNHLTTGKKKENEPDKATEQFETKTEQLLQPAQPSHQLPHLKPEQFRQPEYQYRIGTLDNHLKTGKKKENEPGKATEQLKNEPEKSLQPVHQ